MSPPLPAWTTKLKVDGENYTIRVAEIISTLWPRILTRHSELLDIILHNNNNETNDLLLAKDSVQYSLIHSTADVLSLFLKHILIQS